MPRWPRKSADAITTTAYSTAIAISSGANVSIVKMTATPASIRAIWRPMGLLIIPDTRVDISCLGASTIRFVLRRRLDLPRWRTQPSWRAEQSLVWARSGLQVRAAIVSRSGRTVDDVAWAEIFKLSHGFTSDRNLLRLNSFGARPAASRARCRGRIFRCSRASRSRGHLWGRRR